MAPNEWQEREEVDPVPDTGVRVVVQCESQDGEVVDYFTDKKVREAVQGPEDSGGQVQDAHGHGEGVGAVHGVYGHTT